MTTMNREIYEAFQDAHIDDAKAKAAAESVARYDEMVGEIKRELSGINGKLAILIGLNIGLVLAEIAMFIKG